MMSLANNNPEPRVLVLTVGTGDMEKLESTLLVPLRKSIADGEWDRVVLLPSRATTGAAEQLAESHRDGVSIRVLPEPGMEDNVDACFAFFDSVLGELRQDGIEASDILVDFTRGTKAMSAALVLAATASNLPKLRYIYGAQRDERGQVVPGTEIISSVDARALYARKNLDAVCMLFRHGRFVAVLDLLPDVEHGGRDGVPSNQRPAVAAARRLAEFCAEWDRFNYRYAAGVLARGLDVDSLPSELRSFHPSVGVLDWIRQLDNQPSRSNHKEFATWLRRVVCDVLANGERRLHNGDLEDALIRAYRALEMLGQLRLFDKGLDPSALPESDERIRKFKAERRKNYEKPLAKARGTSEYLEATRELAAHLLKSLGDPLGDELLEVARLDKLGVRRNQSILNHEFDAQAPDPDVLRQVYKQIEMLLREDDRAAAAHLRTARWLAFDGDST